MRIPETLLILVKAKNVGRIPELQTSISGTWEGIVFSTGRRNRRFIEKSPKGSWHSLVFYSNSPWFMKSATLDAG
jgi:hypothetical protein